MPLNNVGCGNMRHQAEMWKLLGEHMATKKVELESMSLDDLWSLHEKVSGILSARIKAEKRELEKRLAVLSRGTELGQLGDSLLAAKPRRKYPRVFPKYRNPQT